MAAAKALDLVPDRRKQDLCRRAYQELHYSTHCASIACIRQLHYADGKFFEFRQFRRSEATCPGDDFVLAFLQFAYQKRGQNPLRLEAGGQFFEALCIKSLSGIGGLVAEVIRRAITRLQSAEHEPGEGAGTESGTASGIGAATGSDRVAERTDCGI